MPRRLALAEARAKHDAEGASAARPLEHSKNRSSPAEGRASNRETEEIYNLSYLTQILANILGKVILTISVYGKSRYLRSNFGNSSNIKYHERIFKFNIAACTLKAFGEAEKETSGALNSGDTCKRRLKDGKY